MMITDKLMRYSQHYETVIVVLFSLQVDERRYLEWERKVKKRSEMSGLFVSDLLHTNIF